eukprot:108526_1
MADYESINEAKSDEVPSIVQETKTLLSKKEARSYIYLILLLLSFVPISSVYVDFFSLASTTFVAIAILLKFCEIKCGIKCICKRNMVKTIYMALLIFGGLFLVGAIIMECFSFDYCGMYKPNKADSRFYPTIGKHILGVFIVICAVVDFSEYWDDKMKRKNYIKTRLICFSVGLMISCLLTTITYGVNKDIYTAEFGQMPICILGYIVVIVVTFFSWIYAFKWFHKCCEQCRLSGGDVLSIVLIGGMIAMQSRPYNDSSVDTLMCFIVAADIQTLKYQ